MSIAITCDKCIHGEVISSIKAVEVEAGYTMVEINGMSKFLCPDCTEKYNQLIKGIGIRQEKEKQKSLELWINNKHS